MTSLTKTIHPSDSSGSVPKIRAWCHGPIPAGKRVDTICCSVRCRQARHRFTTDVGRGVAVGGGIRIGLAYADPPYPGMSKRYYSDHPDFAGEVDHTDLIRRLSTYDGWALSTSARSLPDILTLCPSGVRVAAWHRGERPTRSGGPLNSWEPVIYFGGRQRLRREPSLVDARPVTPGRQDASPLQPRRVNSLVHFSRPRSTDRDRVVGAKPAVFCRWMFDLLGAEPQDDFSDLFPGSGGVTRAWNVFAAPSN